MRSFYVAPSADIPDGSRRLGEFKRLMTGPLEALRPQRPVGKKRTEKARWRKDAWWPR